MAAARRTRISPGVRYQVRWLVVLAIAAAFALPAGARQEEAPRGEEPRMVLNPDEDTALTLPQVFELLRGGTPSSVLIDRVKRHSGGFDLTIEDIVRLRKAGASPDLILAMAGPIAASQAATGPEAVAAAGPTEAEDAPREVADEPAPAGTLTVRRIVKMHRAGTPVPEIEDRIAQEGLKEVPDLDSLLSLRGRGLPDELIRALARGGGASPGSGSPTAPITVAGIVEMLKSGAGQPDIVAAIEARGVTAPPTLEEALALRSAGGSDAIVAAINRSITAPPEAAAGQPVAEEVVALPIDDVASLRDLGDHVPPADREDRLWIASVPTGARVYVSPARGRVREPFSHDFYVGLTPLSLAIGPGEYHVAISKDPSAFDDSLVPAWRTVHDIGDTRTMIDDTDITFDPARCCLPGTLSGRARTYPIDHEQPRSIIGDEFQGLPPYLFDGESLQILAVAGARITQVVKHYTIRKHAGQPRVLVSLFLPAEGDPLDSSEIEGLPPGTPYDAFVDAPGLEYLYDPDLLAGFAATMGVQAAHVEAAVLMLRRAGKAIIHQQTAAGVRLITLMVDDGGRLRLSDRLYRPEDPLAPPPDQAPGESKRKKAAKPPPPPPALPEVARSVEPGLGLPRLTITNTTTAGIGLVFDDGQFCFVPAGGKGEVAIDPGTFQVRLLGSAPDAVTAQGQLHLSYHARYAMTF